LLGIHLFLKKMDVSRVKYSNTILIIRNSPACLREKNTTLMIPHFLTICLIAFLQI
jgi:hypothetical protein